jgi:hypothetical protein
MHGPISEYDDSSRVHVLHPPSTGPLSRWKPSQVLAHFPNDTVTFIVSRNILMKHRLQVCATFSTDVSDRYHPNTRVSYGIYPISPRLFFPAIQSHETAIEFRDSGKFITQKHISSEVGSIRFEVSIQRLPSSE